MVHQYKTGQTFGENTSPSNFDILTRARKEMSQAKWSELDIIEQASAYIPSIALPLPLTPPKLESMTIAAHDLINQGVFNLHDWHRLPLP